MYEGTSILTFSLTIMSKEASLRESGFFFLQMNSSLLESVAVTVICSGSVGRINLAEDCTASVNCPLWGMKSDSLN